MGEILNDVNRTLLVSYQGSSALVRLRNDDSVQCQIRQNARDLVTGDNVLVEGLYSSEPVIIDREERQTELFRTDAQGKKKLVAANLDSIAIVVAPRPEAYLGLVDRYLVAAELAGLEAAIVINKTDLGSDACLDEIRRIYPVLGTRVLDLSAKSDTHIEAFRDWASERHLALLGQSGVGKSSLINALLGSQRAVTGGLSAKKVKGRHTTTASRMYQLSTGGWLMDSPGIREFENNSLEPEQIVRGFPEIAKAALNCEFRNCQHSTDRGCAVQAGLLEGKIEKSRFESFQSFMGQNADSRAKKSSFRRKKRFE